MSFTKDYYTANEHQTIDSSVDMFYNSNVNSFNSSLKWIAINRSLPRCNINQTKRTRHEKHRAGKDLCTKITIPHGLGLVRHMFECLIYGQGTTPGLNVWNSQNGFSERCACLDVSGLNLHVPSECLIWQITGLFRRAWAWLNKNTPDADCAGVGAKGFVKGKSELRMGACISNHNYPVPEFCVWLVVYTNALTKNEGR